MDRFKAMMEMELRRNEQLLENGKRRIASFPEGTLSIRKRKDGETYYWNTNSDKRTTRKRSQVNINDNPTQVQKLAEKRYYQEMIGRASDNIRYLRRAAANYQSIEPKEIIQTLGSPYRQFFMGKRRELLEKRMEAAYSKYPYRADYHTHETDYGEMVRSKSEQILANTLFSYGVPFHYEEEYFYQIGDIGRIYPDFTILLPNGKRIIWEHLGLLGDADYCHRFADKLNIYQQNGLTIGKDLILTMDDAKGNLSSGIIQQIIQEQILPELDGLTMSPEKIIAGIQQTY